MQLLQVQPKRSKPRKQSSQLVSFLLMQLQVARCQQRPHRLQMSPPPMVPSLLTLLRSRTLQRRMPCSS